MASSPAVGASLFMLAIPYSSRVERRMQQERLNCAVARKLYEAFLAADLDAIYALLAPRIEWEIVGTGEVPHFGSIVTWTR